jgi:uncharacterized membrane protein YdjX (TVP38/TMEM64 family)
MRLALWFLALAVLTLAIWLVWGGAWEGQFSLEGSVRWLENAGPWAWAAGILLLAADLVLPVPGTVVISALGYLYGTLLGGVIAATGLIVAGLLGYGAGRLCGESFARRWLGERDFEAGRKLFENGGGWAVALSRALPILPEVISCTAGMVRMPFRCFIIALACGSFPTGLLFAAIGHSGKVAPAWAFVLSLVVPMFLWFGASKMRR